MFTDDNRQNAHNMIDRIFKKLLPARGMAERPEQVQLSHRMLDTMLDDRITLCDAGTGIGKTYAYLVAGMAFILFRAAMGLVFQPIVISTSSIALQRAITEEYIPILSMVLMEGMWINAPIQAVIRKGKTHYVCDVRLQVHLRRVNFQKKNAEAAAALLSLQSHLDMDEAAHLSRYDQERVCVPPACDCGKEDCRYRKFLKDCFEKQYQFQICNHNLLLADAIHRNQDRRPILLEHTALVIDEAHKLPETARHMFGVTLCAGDIQAMVRDLRAEQYPLAADILAECSGPISRKLSEPWDEERPLETYLRLLIQPDRNLRMIQQQLGTSLTLASQSRLKSLITAVSLFCDGNPDMVFYAIANEYGSTDLCATISDLTAQLRSVLWEQFKSQPGSILLATGAAWEGFDFPGDGVSLLIIPRLPFPHPDVMKERERKGYPTLRAYIQAVVIPEMQIKLKQGFGRAIRTETDTCVVAILDERAAPGCRYFSDVKAALPDMRLTSSISEMEQFIRSVKPDEYFRETSS